MDIIIKRITKGTICTIYTKSTITGIRRYNVKVIRAEEHDLIAIDLPYLRRLLKAGISHDKAIWDATIGIHISQICAILAKGYAWKF